MRIVAALGGNALLRRGEPLDAGTQQANVKAAAHALATLAHDNALVVTHGNGPQVGLLALQGEAYGLVKPYPLDVLGAETEGMIGYLIEQQLANELPERRIAALLTQTVVDADDRAFTHPTKPVGPIFTSAEAEVLAAERGWAVAPDGKGVRRVVPSPDPLRIVEIDTIRLLVEAGVVVVCAGGGGIPVVERADGTRHGIEAVVDKDLAAAVLARDLSADLLLLLTDVHAVWTDWGSEYAKPIRRVNPGSLDRREFEEGSMGPKIEAAKRFVRATGHRAVIGGLLDVDRLMRGEAGTHITDDTEQISWWPPEVLTGGN